MSAKLDEGDAAEYICALRTDMARRQCLSHWAVRHGKGYVLSVMAVIKKRYPRRGLGLEGVLSERGGNEHDQKREASAG